MRLARAVNIPVANGAILTCISKVIRSRCLILCLSKKRRTFSVLLIVSSTPSEGVFLTRNMWYSKPHQNLVINLLCIVYCIPWYVISHALRPFPPQTEQKQPLHNACLKWLIHPKDAGNPEIVLNIMYCSGRQAGQCSSIGWVIHEIKPSGRIALISLVTCVPLEHWS